MKRLVYLFAVLLLQANMWMTPTSLAEPAQEEQNTAGEDKQSPRFTADNRIVLGTKGIWQKGLWSRLVFSIDNDAIGYIYEMFDFGKGELNPVFFLNTREEIVGTSSIVSGEIRESTSADEQLGTYTFTMALRDDGLILVEGVGVLDDPRRLVNRYAVLELPAYLNLTGEYVKSENVTSFGGDTSITLAGEDLRDAQIRFFPQDSARSFTIMPVACSHITINANRIIFRPGNEGTFSFLLDIRGEQDLTTPTDLSPNGIDFWGVDRLRLPDYGATRNLIMNPSFEAGLRYWGFPTYVHSAIPLKYQGVFELDGDVAHSGTRSFRLKALPVRSPRSVGHLPAPLIPGERYTYSFWAKGTPDKPVQLNVWGRGMVDQLFPENVLVFDIGEQWKRYTIPFVAKEHFSSIYMDARSMDPDAEDQFVWIDDVQLERGDVTDYTSQPVEAELVSAARGNFLEFGTEPEFKMNIRTRPDADGTVKISVEDFFFETVFEGEYAFTTDASGFATVTLDELSKRVTATELRGVLELSGEFTVAGLDEPFNDYFRFSVMDFLDNTHKNKDMFNLPYVYSLQAGGPDMERFVAREQAIGFGSITYDFIKFANDMDYDLDKERMELLEEYGFGNMGRPVLKLHDGEGGEISERQGEVKMQGIKSMVDPTDEQLAEFESIVELKARNRPWNKIWWFTGESNPGVMPLESHPDAFAKFLLATYRGVKKGNPDAQVLVEGGPWTIEPQYGGKWTERYIQDTRRLDPSITFDGAAAHHYRDFPENPDLDSDIEMFLAMLDRNGCEDWPFYINEGGNYAPFNIPQLGMSPYIVHSANSWYIGPVSYDYGRAERIAAAFAARNWLIGLKHADRVACMQDFNTPNRYVDLDFTPRPYEKIPNTLGRLLGNATFYKDIRFAPETRCYVFTDDETGTPIAALWGHKESVDRWKEDAPLYKFDFTGLEVEFIDLMENKVEFPKDADGRSVIPVSPFPLFIRSKPGTEAPLSEAIAGATAGAAAGNALNISAIPDGPDHAAVTFRNPVSKPFDGDLLIALNGNESTVAVQVPALEQVTKRVAFEPPSGNVGKLQGFDFTCSIDGQTVQTIANPYLFVHDRTGGETGDLNEWLGWEGLASNDLGSGVSMKMAVSQGKLWVAIQAAKHEGSAQEVFNGVGLYVDPFAKLDRWSDPKTAQQDLAVFELIEGASGGLEAMCHHVQGTQAGSGTDFLLRGEVQKAIDVHTIDADGLATLIISIPEEVLAPLELEPDRRLGLNLSVPLKAGGVATLAPIEGYKSPLEPGTMDMVLVVIGE